MMKTRWATDERCPKCGATLLTNGRAVWCSFVGGGKVKACDYGIKERVAVERKRQAMEKLG